MSHNNTSSQKANQQTAWRNGSGRSSFNTELAWDLRITDTAQCSLKVFIGKYCNHQGYFYLCVAFERCAQLHLSIQLWKHHVPYFINDKKKCNALFLNVLVKTRRGELAKSPSESEDRQCGQLEFSLSKTPSPGHPSQLGSTHDISYKCAVDEYPSAVLICQSSCTLGVDDTINPYPLSSPSF